MSKDIEKNINEEPEEEMTVELELDDGSIANCAVITILEVDGYAQVLWFMMTDGGGFET